MHHDTPNSIADVAGLEIGHFTDPRRPTGCTVVIARDGAVGGVDVRGAAPGTRETDLLAPTNLVERVHAIVLAGGSAWGLEAATGAVRWLEEQGVGMPVGPARLPIVPAAVLFDLLVGDCGIRPDAEAGYRACQAASRNAPAEGNVGARTADGKRLLDSRRALLAGEAPRPLLAGTNTTIGVIATDAVISKVQATRLAQMGHDGLARSINPVHTMSDGDTLFALGTGASGQTLGMMTLGTMAAEATARAVVRAVRAARGITVAGLHLPALADLDRQ
jgi:L-aminopeptidase/D-esterase-like protein